MKAEEEHKKAEAEAEAAIMGEEARKEEGGNERGKHMSAIKAEEKCKMAEAEAAIKREEDRKEEEENEKETEQEKGDGEGAEG